ncbi:MAG: orotidine 5'-phosphate decarboxylase / HUMPS family protein, partial [Stellaceae bacterium]
DQKRTATPYDAILNGADYLVVGRPIIQQENKRLAARNIIKDMEAALDDRGNSTRSASLPASAAVY